MPQLPHFENEKKQVLLKLATIDKSKKGSVDTPILPILELINAHESYYTTSSCSGRILVIAVSPERRKDETEWPLASHEKVASDQVWQAIQESPPGDLWLRQESAILHIACKNLESAELLLDLVRQAGFKRAGIIATTRRIMIEIIGTDTVAIPLGTKDRLKATRDYIDFAVEQCNERMDSNEKKLKKLLAALKEKLPSH